MKEIICLAKSQTRFDRITSPNSAIKNDKPQFWENQEKISCQDRILHSKVTGWEAQHWLLPLHGYPVPCTFKKASTFHSNVCLLNVSMLIHLQSNFPQKPQNFMLVGGWATPLKNMNVNWDD